MLTSHRLLQQYWHDARFNHAKVWIWYTDRGAPGDISVANGPAISLEPYYFIVRAPASEKPVPYHRILLITYDGVPVFENLKAPGLGEQIAGQDHPPG
jgi:uncharacterized protein (UPF0248 family)